MKYKWKLYPGDYALGENEKFYGDMEAKGWRLVKRGAYWSKFEQVEPSRARYRVEVVKPAFLDPDGGALPEEQIAVYEDCGWEYVASRRMLHFFLAPEGSDAPEFYQDPRQQAETLKSVRQNLIWSLVVCIVLSDMGHGLGRGADRLHGQHQPPGAYPHRAVGVLGTPGSMWKTRDKRPLCSIRRCTA